LHDTIHNQCNADTSSSSSDQKIRRKKENKREARTENKQTQCLGRGNNYSGIKGRSIYVAIAMKSIAEKREENSKNNGLHFTSLHCKAKVTYFS
jgi:hypothetical protein